VIQHKTAQNSPLGDTRKILFGLDSRKHIQLEEKAAEWKKNLIKSSSNVRRSLKLDNMQMPKFH